MPKETRTVSSSRDKLSSTQISRELREIDAEHRAGESGHRQALARTFDPSAKATGADKRSLVGLPTDRRSFLRIGGLTVAMGTIAAACGGGETDAGLTRTGATPPPTSPTTTTLPSSELLDLELLRTAASIEALAIATYEQVLDEGLLTERSLIDVVELFAQHHEAHLSLLSGTIADLDGEPYTDANPFLLAEVVEPAVADLADIEEPDEVQTAALALAYALEDIAAQTYNSSGLLLTTPELRQTAMSIGGTEARHVSVILGALGQPQVPFAFGRTVGAAPDEALVGSS